VSSPHRPEFVLSVSTGDCSFVTESRGKVWPKTATCTHHASGAAATAEQANANEARLASFKAMADTAEFWAWCNAEAERRAPGGGPFHRRWIGPGKLNVERGDPATPRGCKPSRIERRTT
jgi:hypothetical protein